jgi:hypothetical protein
MSVRHLQAYVLNAVLVQGKTLSFIREVSGNKVLDYCRGVVFAACVILSFKTRFGGGRNGTVYIRDAINSHGG